MAALPLLILPVLWLLLVRPQQRRMRAQQDLVRSLAVGDDVLTTAGIYGSIVALDEEVATVEVAEGVHLRVARMAIGRRLIGPATEPLPDAPSPPLGTGDGGDHPLPPPPEAQ